MKCDGVAWAVAPPWLVSQWYSWQIHHPHIVALYAFYADEHYYYLVTELLRGGELLEVLSHQDTFSEEGARHVIQQMCTALAYAQLPFSCAHDPSAYGVCVAVFVSITVHFTTAVWPTVI